MSGRHDWNELSRDLSPERQQRVAEAAAAIDATLPPDEPCAVVPMRMLRELEDTPMSELEAALQTDEAGVLAFEECDDPAVSQLRSYATAMGARLKIVIDFPDYEVILADYYQKRRWPVRPATEPDSYYDKVGKPLPPIPTGPTTYREIEWAAQIYRGRRDGRNFEEAYRDVYKSEFRKALLNRCSSDDITRLLLFLNKWGARWSCEKMTPVLLEAVPEAIASLRCLATALPDDDGLDDWDAALVMRAVDRLMADDGVGATLASKILGIVNPEFFVMWDRDIQLAYFPRHQPDTFGAGARYARFLSDMMQAAKCIRKDAIEQHDISDPAGCLSRTFGLNPSFTLAKFIEEYNFLTITKGKTYPGLQPSRSKNA